MRRRELIGGVGISLSTAVAGCLDFIDQEPGDEIEARVTRILLLGWRREDEEVIERSLFSLNEDSNVELIWLEDLIDEEEISTDVMLADLPMEEIYDEFEGVVCQISIYLSTDDEVNDVEATHETDHPASLYALEMDLFDQIEVGNEYRFQVASPEEQTQPTYQLSFPRLIQIISDEE